MVPLLADFDRCVPHTRAREAGGGTRSTNAPERLAGAEVYDFKADIFSVG